MLRIYLAGPEVFLSRAIELGRRKKQLCATYGFEGLYPLDNEIAATDDGEPLDRLIYRANEAMIRSADLGICNLTPFRGPGADAGTVFELGLMIGLGKRVFAYTNEGADYTDRVRASRDVTFDQDTRMWRDEAGLMVEDFGNADNLMLDCGLLEHGGGAIVRPAGLVTDPLHDLTTFEACLCRAAQALGKTA